MHSVQDKGKVRDVQNLTSLKIRLHREKKARLAAEDIIEKKSQELFDAGKELEQLLSGSIIILTSVLALARPEVFQKATKVQRWARRVAPLLDVKRPWELDLAAVLYPLGIIGLPDEIALKYANDEHLSENENELINESSRKAFQLINNIERMKGVAEAILYSRKCFDGSGSPKNGEIGENIPYIGRILKVLIDLADNSTGAKLTRADGFMKMASRKNEYDIDILKICYIELLEVSEGKREEEQTYSLVPGSLMPGDVLDKDIVDVDNNLLLAAGCELSEMSINRIRSLSGKGRLHDDVRIKKADVQVTDI